MKRWMIMLLAITAAGSSVIAGERWVEVPSVVSTTAPLLVGSERGTQVLANRPRVYRGVVNDSLSATLVVCGAERLVVVRDVHGMRAYWDGVPSDAVRSTADVPTAAFECLPRQAPHGKAMLHDAAQGADDGRGLRVRVAVEADYEYFVSAGQRSADRALAYTTALFMVVRDVYEDEADISFEISWFKVWTDSTSDPYKVKGNAYALPDLVRPYWKEHYDTVPRDLAHVMTSVGYGGGGFGYFGALCNREYGFSVSSPTGFAALPQFGFTYDAYIVGHELGHNFDARHTHDCFWEPALDTCFTKDDVQLKLGDACHSLPITPRKSEGSWLSYCANANYALSGNDFSQFTLSMTLLPRVASFIRETAVAATVAGCLPITTEPLLYLRRPLGGVDVAGGTMLAIEWGHRNVSMVNVDVSSNLGNTWQAIEHGIDATAGSVMWNIANADVPAVLLRVSDASDASRSDVVSVPLRIRQTTSVASTRTDVTIKIHEGIVHVAEHAQAVVTIMDMLGRVYDRRACNGGEQLVLPSTMGMWIVTTQSSTGFAATTLMLRSLRY